METKKIILLIMGLFLVSLVYALGPIPPIPDHFIGNVTIDGQSAPVGTQISIYVDSTLEDLVLTTIIGKYDLYVKTGESNNIYQSSIQFKIQDKLAGSSTRQGGETIYRDLSITTTTSNPPSSSGSSGGGGSGGGGGGGYVAPTQNITLNETDIIPENTNGKEIKEKENETTDFGMTGAVIDFVGSGKGITAIMVIIILGIGAVLIKFKTLKWKRNY